MSTQLICKVIKILETLISIILMNTDGKGCFGKEKKKQRICQLLGNIGVGGCVGQFDI